MKRSNFYVATMGTVVATVVAGMIGGVSMATPATAAPAAFQVLADQQKQDLDLHILVGFVPYAETFWRASDIPEANTGRYLADGAGVTQARGAGDIAFAYATLLTASPTEQSFGGVPRATMLDHTIKSIRYEALTNVLSGAGYNTWGGNTWQASLETYGWAYAAHLLWSQLDADTQGLVRSVLTGEANILITKPIATATPGDTGAEDNAWNTPTPALAAVMFPTDPNRAAWEQTTIKLALNASSTGADASSATVVDGKPLSAWMASTNLNADLTIQNHGFFNPIYQQVTHTLIGDAAIFYAQDRRQLPQAFSFRTQEIWDQILGRLADDNGDIVMPAGQDWISKDFQHLDYLSILSTRFGDADASVLESRALQTIAQRQATHANGSILGQPGLGYESMLIKRLAASWWNHHLFNPSPTPTQAEFDSSRASTAGVTDLPSVGVIAARLHGASAFMSWDSARPMGLWIPGQQAHPDDPIFTYYAPYSLIGSARGPVSAYTCNCADDRFSTAGVIGGRDFSMTTFPDGIALLLDRGTGSTFTYSLEEIPGVTGDRPVYSAGGTGIGTLPGTWVNVADRMGMVVLGGGGITATDVHSTNDSRLLTGSAATGTGNRGAMLLPNIDHQTTAQLAGYGQQPQVPDGWSALAVRAPDGTDRLAVARWAGPASAPLSISDDRGAPVPTEQAQVKGTTASFSAALQTPASEGETLRFFVQSDGTLLAHQDGENRAVITNPGQSPVHAKTTYVAADGTTTTVARVLAPGETAVARIVQGHLTLAGPEYGYLLAARSTLTHLQTAVARWQAQGSLGTSDAQQLMTTSTRAIGHIDKAIAAAKTTEPDTNKAAAAVMSAANAVAKLSPTAAMPTDIQDAITRDQRDATTALQQAQTYLAVVIDVSLIGSALSGEPLTLRVSEFNRGHGAATNGALSIQAPAGWTLPHGTPVFHSLAPGATRTVDLTGTVAPDAAPGTADIAASISYQAEGQPLTAATTVAIPVQPLYTLTPEVPSLALASGGWNQATFALRNNAPHSLDVILSARPPAGIIATINQAHVSVPASGDATVTIDLSNAGQISGTGQLTVAATSSTNVTATATEQLLYSDNLAWNPTGAPFPSAFAGSNQAAYPPALVNDGNPGTFWVSGGASAAGDGPTPTHPIALGVDLGTPLTFGSVTVKPRTGYGPKSYEVQISTDGQSWTPIAQVVNGPNAPLTTSFAPTSARYVRLLMTSAYDRTNRNVQVAELEVRPS